MYNYNHHQKRKHHQDTGNHEEETVDDLAVAANFAFITSENSIHQDIPRENDDSDDDSEDNDDSTTSTDKTSGDKNDDQQESEDDESDVDLSDQLAKMKDDGDLSDNEDEIGRKKNNKDVSDRPITQNEIDLYSCSMSVLKEKLNLSLDIDDEVKKTMLFQPSKIPGILTANVSPTQIRLAGCVKSHLISERTIVVQSELVGESISGNGVPYRQQHQILLDEGSLLLLLIGQNDDIKSKLLDDKATLDSDNKIVVVSLGKILEVFGPVAKPLYTIRLSHIIEENKYFDIDQTNEVQSDLPARFASNECQDDKARREFSAESAEAKTDNKNVSIKRALDDPWAQDGILTQWLISNPSMKIYYCYDQVKIVDPHTVALNSKKGCDASNVFDEEVTDIHEMYFSDDEVEREVKHSKKKGNRHKNDGTTQNTNFRDVSSFRQTINPFRPSYHPNHQPNSNSHYQNQQSGLSHGYPQPFQNLYQQPSSTHYHQGYATHDAAHNTYQPQGLLPQYSQHQYGYQQLNMQQYPPRLNATHEQVPPGVPTSNYAMQHQPIQPPYQQQYSGPFPHPGGYDPSRQVAYAASGPMVSYPSSNHPWTGQSIPPPPPPRVLERPKDKNESDTVYYNYSG